MKITDSAIEEIIGIFLNYFALFAFFAANRNKKGVVQLRCLGLISSFGLKWFTRGLRNHHIAGTAGRGTSASFPPSWTELSASGQMDHDEVAAKSRGQQRVRDVDVLVLHLHETEVLLGLNLTARRELQ